MLGLSTSSDEDLDNDLRQGIDNIMWVTLTLTSSLLIILNICGKGYPWLKSFLALPYKCHTFRDIYGSSSQDLIEWVSSSHQSPWFLSVDHILKRRARGDKYCLPQWPGTGADFNGFIVLIVHIIFILSLLSPVWPRLFLLSILKMSQHSARGGGGGRHTVHIQISFLLVLDNFDIAIALFGEGLCWQTRYKHSQ